MRQIILSLAVFLSFSLDAHTYFSQYQQDKIVNEAFFHDMKDGVFVDIGAHNGVTFSNTLFFEKDLGWTGLCIEPLPEVFNQLTENRTCKCIHGCVANSPKDALFFRAATPVIGTEMLSGLVKTYDPAHYQRLTHEINQTGGQLQVLTVNCFVLNDLLQYNKIDHVNFLSIDTEGSELEILESIDYDKYTIDVISVEDTYYDSRFIPFLEKKGFKFVRRTNQDLIFVNSAFTPPKKQKTKVKNAK